MIDTHAHIYAEEFKDDLNEVLDRARSKGVTKIFLPNIDESSIVGLKALAEQSDDIYPMMGLHPCSVKDDFKHQLETIKKELYTNDYIAVGEIGLDLYWDKSKKKQQIEAFVTQCEWAAELNLPIAIHSRDATDELIAILEDFTKNRKLTGVFHCFTGTEIQAKKVLDLGFYLGIGGVLTFKNSNLRDVLKSVSLDRLVLETDAPYLAPTPYRGKRNEPSYVSEVAQHLTYVYDCSLKEVIDATTDSALNLFKL